jgi:hypothetical protein
MPLPPRFYIFGYLHAPSDWELTESFEWGHRGWSLTSGLRRNKKDLSLDGAVTSAPDFVSALREIVAAHPELAEWSIDTHPISDILAVDTSTPVHRKVYLHGTSEAAYEIIKSEGLLPRSMSGAAAAHGAHVVGAPRASEHAVYLTTEMDTAAWASRDAARGGSRGRRVVLRVSPPFNAERFSADEDAGRARSATASLQTLGSVAYHGAIPPEQIELHAVYDDDATEWVFQNPLKLKSRLARRRNPLIVPGVDLVDDLFYASIWGLKQFGQDLDMSPQVPGVTKELVAALAAANDAYIAAPTPANRKAREVLADKAIALLEDYSDPDGSFLDDVIAGLDALAAAAPSPVEFDPIEGLLYFSPEFRRARVFDDKVEAFLEDVTVSAPSEWITLPSFAGAQARIVLFLSEEDTMARYGLNTAIQLELLPIVEGAAGFFKYVARDNTSVIGLTVLPSKTRRATDFIGTLYLTIAHETIHLLQNLKGIEAALPQSSDYTGLPYTRRKEFLTHDTAMAEILRAQLSELGVDEDLVQMHTLDDIEFYTKLFEEIIFFLQHIEQLTTTHTDPSTGCPVDLEALVAAFIRERKFFRVLKQLQPDKFELASREFLEAIQTRRDEFDSLFVCKIKDPRLAIRPPRRL